MFILTFYNYISKHNDNNKYLRNVKHFFYKYIYK